jgi:hypothetical protein
VSQFDYLAVLISIVLGLGIANVLSGFGAIVQARARLKLYAPTFFHMANIFVIHVQMWWTMFGLREVRHWNFAQFLVVLMQPVLVYLMSVFIVPAIPPEGRVDLKELYFREHGWFSGGLMLTILDSLARNVAVGGHLPETPDLIAHGVFFGLGVVGLVSKSSKVHNILAPAISVLLAVYVGALFANLR